VVLQACAEPALRSSRLQQHGVQHAAADDSQSSVQAAAGASSSSLGQAPTGLTPEHAMADPYDLEGGACECHESLDVVLIPLQPVTTWHAV